jgi:hypothetical protein
LRGVCVYMGYCGWLDNRLANPRVVPRAVPRAYANRDRMITRT